MFFSGSLNSFYSYLLKTVFITGAFISILSKDVFANPIYVYHGPGGVVRFSSKPPSDGSPVEVWTAKNAKFSVLNARKPKGKSFRLRRELFNDQIKSAALLHDVDESLIRAVIHAESAFDKFAVSPKGARGLMQLMPDTARRFGVRNAFSPTENISAGTRYLAFLLERFNDNLQLAVAAYNAGEGAVDQYSGIPPFAETKQYVTRVINLKHQYERAG